jgi:3-hydroxy-3-methylglutaryl CoA synthase
VPKFIIEVYVCPTCGNYYGASSAGNLAQKVASADKGKKLLCLRSN